MWEPAISKAASPVTASQPIMSIAFSRDGNRLACGDRRGGIELRESRSGRALSYRPVHDSLITSVSLGPEGGRVASTSEDRTVRLTDLASGNSLLKFSGGDEFVDVTFAHRENLLAFMGRDGRVWIWDPSSNTPLPGRSMEVGGIGSHLAFSPDDRLLAAGDKNSGSVFLWEVRTGSVSSIW